MVTSDQIVGNPKTPHNIKSLKKSFSPSKNTVTGLQMKTNKNILMLSIKERPLKKRQTTSQPGSQRLVTTRQQPQKKPTSELEAIKWRQNKTTKILSKILFSS